MTPYETRDAAYWATETQKYVEPHKRLERIVESVPAGKVLDIGCGPGTLGDLLKQKPVSYTGVDIFPQTLTGARYGTFDLARDSFAQFPFPERFDTIVVSGVFEYVPESRIAELLRYIRSTLVHEHTLLIISYTNFVHYERKPDTYHPQWITTIDYRVLERDLAIAGFKEERKYPSYYFLVGRRIGTPKGWTPFFSRFFGRQIVFLLRPVVAA